MFNLFFVHIERLQTELEFSVPGRKDNVDENGPIIDKNGHQSHKVSHAILCFHQFLN